MRIIPVLIIVTIFLLVDWYIYKSLSKTNTKRWIKLIFPLSSVAHLLVYFLYFFMFYRGNLYAPYVMNLLVGITFLIFIGKLFTVLILLTEQIGNLSIRLSNLFKKPERRVVPSRRTFVRNTSLGVAAIPLLTGFFGLVIGKYLYKVQRVKLKSNRLPESFKGFKIVQISDFHAGSFDWFEQVKEGMEKINELEPDLIVFTGDLVNNRTAEVLPFQELWTNLKAKHGKFAVLGNHDYGDYVPWESEQERQENLELMFRFYEDTGFKLLMNENKLIEIEGQKIALAGVENWGTGRFPKYGKINEALEGVDNEMFTVLLSHDPDHWKEQVRHLDNPIDLTLSGHTHGAQFGVPIPGGVWSPASWRYDFWKGLYKQDQIRHLYVNTGFGFLGYPGRINMAPEITLFELG
mgnify:CR=1 FL=1